MSTQLNLSKIVLAAALGAASTAYAGTQSTSEQDNSAVPTPSTLLYSTRTGDVTIGGNAATSNNTTVNVANTVTNISNVNPVHKIIQQTSVHQNGIFTDTVATSTVFEVEELEIDDSVKHVLSTPDGTLSLTLSSTAYNNAALGAIRKTNTYVQTGICTINRFYGECTTSAPVKIGSQPAP